MITEFALAAGFVFTCNYLNSNKHKIKKIFNETMENNNLEYKLINIEKSNYGYKLIVSLYGQGFDKLENSTDLLECSLGHDLFIEQNNNLKTATINVFTNKLDDNIKFKPYKTEPHEIYFGLSYKFEPLLIDMNQIPHVLVSGQTGCGKSELIRLILTNLIYNHSDRDINIYFSDLADTCDFDTFKYCKQIKGHAKNLHESKELFEYMMHIYSKRLNIFSKRGCKNIKEYNSRYNDKKMAYIYLVLDEFADFFPVNKAEDGYEYKVICYNILRHIN